MVVRLDSRWQPAASSDAPATVLSDRWTLTGAHADDTPCALLDGTDASTAAGRLFQVRSVRGTRWEVHMASNALIAEGGDLDVLGTAAEVLVDELDAVLALYRRAFATARPSLRFAFDAVALQVG